MRHLKIKSELIALADPQKANFATRYFKTGKGEYGEGDVFLGLTVPQTRQVAKKHTDLSPDELEKLLHDKIHEFRLAALMIMTEKFRTAGESERKELFQFYLANTKFINNWDLIDGSAPGIVGGYLLDKPKERKILYKLAQSKSLWERRTAILSTYTFLKQKDLKDTLVIAEILINDPQDLIHKAVGWMLREVGKRDQNAEETFLNKYYKTMPRTMLRYAIERLSPTKRHKYMLKPK